MDVRCTRCGTEYEFDDALISERGTSVRCTQCGFQFKVFPPQLATVGPDEWVVLTSLGRRVVYRSLRELQSGIAKSEVAREDLLARGSKPPRPLGSIAELDPLFATKAAPERNPSTLTGVAPPAQGAAAKGTPPPGGSLGRAGHDTFSGVAPPANTSAADAQEPAAQPRPGPPMRVGGTRTVLGIGTGTESTGTGPVAPTRSTAGFDSAPPETRAFDADGGGPPFGESNADAGAAAAPSIEPPTNRPPPPEQAAAVPSPEGAPPLPRIATELGVAPAAAAAQLEGNTFPLPPTHVEPVAAGAQGATRAEPAPSPPRTGTKTDSDESEQPQLEKPPLPRRTGANTAEPTPGDEKRPDVQRADEKRSDVQRADEKRPDVQHADEKRPDVQHADEMKVVAKVQLTTKAVAVSTKDRAQAVGTSDAPTARWAGQVIEEQKSAAPATEQPTKPSEPALVAPSAVPATARSGELHSGAKHSGERTTEPPRSDSRKLVVNMGEIAKHRGDTSSPPTRSRSKVPHAAGRASDQFSQRSHPSNTLASGSLPPKPLFTTGRVTVAVVLIGLGLFAGMKIVGSQLGPSTVPAPAPSLPVAAVQPTSAASWDAPVIELLKIGDFGGAEQALAGVSTTDQNQAAYRILQAQALTQSADMVWWKVQLIGKASGEAYTQAKQQLSERLERVKVSLAAVGPEAEWPESIQAAYLDARRMRGEKSEPTEPTLIQRLKQPATAELKYTGLVLAWVRSGTPDEKTIEGLRRLRATPVDIGPRAVALVAALVQTNRFEDAKSELNRLSTQSRPHPLLEELRAYVTKAAQARADDSAGVTLDAGTHDRNESALSDAELLEGDFRLRLTRASECLSRNELTKAQRLLRSVLAQRPNDTEAITALGDVSRRRGDLTQARELYDKALGLNANYLPAMSGSADIRWRSGDRAGAAGLYRRILERVGETPGYGQVAAARLREVDGSAKPAADSASDSSSARDGKATTTKSEAKGAP